MSDLRKFAALIKAQFDEMSKGELFVTNVSGDDLFANYLAAFPAGTNEIFRERTEHDCSCCKNFIRNIGNVVAVRNGQLVSVWDVIGAEHPYDTVAVALAEAVKAQPIAHLFRTTEPTYGAEITRDLRPDSSVLTWHHFHAKIAAKHYAGRESAAQIGTYASAVQVFRRGLTELKASALNDVINLIESNSLYRGEEHLPAVEAFLKLHDEYRTKSDTELFVWSHAADRAACFRNTVIGTLVTDLSDGVDIEAAVKSFEQKVAPTNYKRPTAIITPRMVEDAMKTIKELDLEPALERRFATIGDISVNNVLWVDGSVRGAMKDGIGSILMQAATPTKLDDGKAEDISIADFMASVLPQAKTIDLVVKNSQQSNFVSLTAPVHADSKRLFKWANDFAWSYAGEVTDAIKERVKAAGGTVEGDLCCRLAWEYTDDLDFHMKEPGGGHIHFGNRRQLSRCGGMLDIDANGADGQRDDPAENIFYSDRRKMKEGQYELQVHNYNRRSNGKGFVVQIEFDGQIFNMAYDKVLPQSALMTVAKIQYKGGVFSIVESLPHSQTVRNVWGVPTETPVKVRTILHSPNHWDDQAIGNKHTIFVLDGCKNDKPVRGIYNEFLSANLEKHRKVFEVLGDKTKCQPTDNQLSGVGFSSTKGDSVLVRVIGDKLRKTYNINF